MCRVGSLLLVSLFACLTGFQAQAASFKIATFNIRFYGLGGKYNGNPNQETRDPHLKRFIQEKLSGVSIIAFQEIVNPERLQREVLPQGWQCFTYDHSEPSHQHVVVCHSNEFQSRRESSDNNDIIDDTAIPTERARPALTRILTDKKGRDVLRVVDVHLKSQPEESLTRVEQVKRISAYLKGVDNPEVPVLILGDFNTFPANQNGQNKSDVELMSEIFDSERLGLVRAEHSKYTYRNRERRTQLDQIWYDTKLKAIQSVEVLGVCNQSKKEDSGNGYSNPKYYYDKVSDHCPVVFSFEI